MTIRHLQIFVDVADSGKMTSAAEKLYISQSSVSQAIADIESEYKIKLFERLNKRLYITAAGEELLRYARNILSLYIDMDDSMRGRKPTLRIGSTFTIAASILSDLIRQLDKSQPLVRTEVVVERTGNLETMLLRNELDMALVEGKIRSEDLIQTPLLDDELFLVCSPAHPFFQRDEIYLRELQDQPFVQREKGSRTRWLLEHHLQQHGVQVYNKWVCNNNEAIKSAVIGGHGMAVMSGRILMAECENGLVKLVRIKDVSLSRKFSMVYHKDKYISKDLSHLINICLQYSQFLQENQENKKRLMMSPENTTDLSDDFPSPNVVS